MTFFTPPQGFLTRRTSRTATTPTARRPARSTFRTVPSSRSNALICGAAATPRSPPTRTGASESRRVSRPGSRRSWLAEDPAQAAKLRLHLRNRVAENERSEKAKRRGHTECRDADGRDERPDHDAADRRRHGEPVRPAEHRLVEHALQRGFGEDLDDNRAGSAHRRQRYSNGDGRIDGEQWHRQRDRNESDREHGRLMWQPQQPAGAERAGNAAGSETGQQVTEAVHAHAEPPRNEHQQHGARAVDEAAQDVGADQPERARLPAQR